ncbi:MAG: hypothetical protein JW976_08030 [Syntrophaceae bacterium]|nr:hypothetical protein [Syntrophaceae bacterium]
MKKLSSNSTFFYKKIFPAMWFGFIVFFVWVGFFVDGKDKIPDIMIVLFPVIMALVGYLVMKNLIFDLMDEVYDEGSSLLFKNKGKSVRINLADIKNVSYTILINPPRVTLSLRCKTEFGDEITFSLPGSIIPFKKNKDIVELIDRIDRARG